MWCLSFLRRRIQFNSRVIFKPLSIAMAAKVSQHAVLVENAPRGIEFGIDYNTWYIGPRFSGIQSIPNGFHFVFTSNVKGKQHAPRNGLFLFLIKENLSDSLKCCLHRTLWDERNEEMIVPFKRCSSESLTGHYSYNTLLENLHSLATMQLCQTRCSQLQQKALACENKRSIVDLATLAAFLSRIRMYSQLAPSNLFHSLLRVGQIMHVFQPGFPHFKLDSVVSVSISLCIGNTYTLVSLLIASQTF